MGLISESKLYPHQMLFLIHRHVDLAQARREMMMAMDSALMIGFHATRCQLSTNFSSNGAPSSSWRVGGKFHGDPRDVRGDPGCCSTVRMIKSRQRRNLACASPGESLPDSPKNSWIQNYHPSEEIREPLPVDDGELARLTDAETARTLIESTIKVQDFHRARPDVIAHSAPIILSRLKAGGEKTTQALKALCWRYKGIQVEEASIIGLDSAGFDLRVCSGTQIQTLRFAFSTRATSEFSAEKQTHDLLFPRFLPQKQKRESAQSRDR